MTGVFFLLFLGVVYYGMYAAATASEYYGLFRGVKKGGVEWWRWWWGGVTMTTGLLRGLGLLVEKGKEKCACNEPGACMSSSVGSVRAYVRARVRALALARGLEGGGGRLEYYGLSVAEVTMQSPV